MIVKDNDISITKGDAMFRRGFDGPFDDEHGFGPGGFRARRGMIEPAILQVLLESPMHGYEIITKIEEQSHGIWRPSAGSVYPTLQLLEEKDLVTVKMESGKKVYTLTDEGKESAKMAETLRESWGQRMTSLHEYHRQFHKEFGGIVKIMRQIFRNGDQDQKSAMSDATAQFKARLEQILQGEA